MKRTIVTIAIRSGTDSMKEVEVNVQTEEKAKTVYLAGKITGDRGYRIKFREAKKTLEATGLIVISPTCLPPKGFSWEAYMRMTAAMLDECDAVCFLPDWTFSRGAILEFQRAMRTGKEIIMYADWEKEQLERCRKGRW